MTARTANALLQGVNRINKRFKEIKTPFIVFQGGDDLIVDERAVREFFNQADVIDKEIVYYPDMRHDVCHEPEIVEIIDTLLFWVQNRS